jgi:6-phosphogluconate dehydrogenase
MQSIAEGLDILRTHKGVDGSFDFDLADITEVWRRGSVITSWLLDLTATALAADGDLTSYSGRVADSGEGRWTVQAAIEASVPLEALSSALFARFRSRQDHTFAEKVLSAMRQGFGGHVESKTDK